MKKLITGLVLGATILSAQANLHNFPEGQKITLYSETGELPFIFKNALGRDSEIALTIKGKNTVGKLESTTFYLGVVKNKGKVKINIPVIGFKGMNKEYKVCTEGLGGKGHKYQTCSSIFVGRY